MEVKREIADDSSGPGSPYSQQCSYCCQHVRCRFIVISGRHLLYFCGIDCFSAISNLPMDSLMPSSKSNTASVFKACTECDAAHTLISWQDLFFCKLSCLESRLSKLNTHCYSCSTSISPISIGRYSCKIKNELYQFCSTQCLSLFKTQNVLCDFCLTPILQQPFCASHEGSSLKLCSEPCFKSYLSNCTRPPTAVFYSQPTPDSASLPACGVCNKAAQMKHEIRTNSDVTRLCSDTCFSAYKFTKKLGSNKCEHCNCLFDFVDDTLNNGANVYQLSGNRVILCSSHCWKEFKAAHNMETPCGVCQARCCNTDMIESVLPATQAVTSFCSAACLRQLFGAITQQNHCVFCKKPGASLHYRPPTGPPNLLFCSSTCLTGFLQQTKRANPTVTYPSSPSTRVCPSPSTPVIAGVHSLNGGLGMYNNQFLLPPGMPNAGPNDATEKQRKNKSTLVRPISTSKATHCSLRPPTVNSSTNTDEVAKEKVYIPVPFPLYVPMPMCMYKMPVPHPLPIPVPVPIPYFIPVSNQLRDTVDGDITELSNEAPDNPFEADLLQLAEAVERAEKEAQMEVAQQDEISGGDSFGQDVNLSSTCAPSPKRARFDDAGGVAKSSKSRHSAKAVDDNSFSKPDSPSTADQLPPVKSDAECMLKFSYGLNAWKHWITQKNQAVTESGNSRLRSFRMNLVEYSQLDLNNALRLFVREVRKPNGEEYALDSIFYLCLGLQSFLMDNGRVDNIFCDAPYRQFAEALNEVVARFEPCINAAGQLVCRIEEEHLWETQQLGAHSPFSLLNTLIYFNTKHFLLFSAEEHRKMSFTHIMKHWRNTTLPNGKQSSVTYLRYHRFKSYQPAMQPGRRRTTTPKDEESCLEQEQNLDNPIRCPIKLYEFYISKCPESLKSRTDMFYLVPEPSCLPDSPVWYSTESLDLKSIERMLNRIRLVREIQEAQLNASHRQ